MTLMRLQLEVAKIVKNGPSAPWDLLGDFFLQNLSFCGYLMFFHFLRLVCRVVWLEVTYLILLGESKTKVALVQSFDVLLGAFLE